MWVVVIMRITLSYENIFIVWGKCCVQKAVAESNQTFNTCKRRKFIDDTIIQRGRTFFYYHSFPVMRAFDDNFMAVTRGKDILFLSFFFRRNVKMVNYKNVKATTKNEDRKTLQYQRKQ